MERTLRSPPLRVEDPHPNGQPLDSTTKLCDIFLVWLAPLAHVEVFAQASTRNLQGRFETHSLDVSVLLTIEVFVLTVRLFYVQ